MTFRSVLQGVTPLLPLALMGACASQRPAPAHDLRAERLASLEASARKCGYPPSGWELRGTDDLHLKPDPNTPYEVVDCMLAETRKSGLAKMGFVGNETYEEPGNVQ